jgi:hypothetical protein
MEVSGQFHAPAALPPGKERLGGPSVGLDAVDSRKILHCRELNRVVIPTELSRLLFLQGTDWSKMKQESL